MDNRTEAELACIDAIAMRESLAGLTERAENLQRQIERIDSRQATWAPSLSPSLPTEFELPAPYVHILHRAFSGV